MARGKEPAVHSKQPSFEVMQCDCADGGGVLTPQLKSLNAKELLHMMDITMPLQLACLVHEPYNPSDTCY